MVFSKFSKMHSESFKFSTSSFPYSCSTNLIPTKVNPARNNFSRTLTNNLHEKEFNQSHIKSIVSHFKCVKLIVNTDNNGSGSAAKLERTAQSFNQVGGTCAAHAQCLG